MPSLEDMARAELDVAPEETVDGCFWAGQTLCHTGSHADLRLVLRAVLHQARCPSELTQSVCLERAAKVPSLHTALLAAVATPPRGGDQPQSEVSRTQHRAASLLARAPSRQGQLAIARLAASLGHPCDVQLNAALVNITAALGVAPAPVESELIRAMEAPCSQHPSWEALRSVSSERLHAAFATSP